MDWYVALWGYSGYLAYMKPCVQPLVQTKRKKRTLAKVKRQYNKQKKIFANHISGKELYNSLIIKAQFENWAKDLNR
jgi:hypothetical protein